MSHLGDLISAYLDGETSAAESSKVIAHLNTCERCRAEMSDVHAARGALRSLPVLEVPVGVFDDLGMTSNVVPLRRRPVAWVAAAAAAALIVVTSAAIATPDAIGVPLTDVSLNHGQQQMTDPGIAPKLVLLSGLEQ